MKTQDPSIFEPMKEDVAKDTIVLAGQKNEWVKIGNIEANLEPNNLLWYLQDYTEGRIQDSDNGLFGDAMLILQDFLKKEIK